MALRYVAAELPGAALKSRADDWLTPGVDTVSETIHTSESALSSAGGLYLDFLWGRVGLVEDEKFFWIAGKKGVWRKIDGPGPQAGFAFVDSRGYATANPAFGRDGNLYIGESATGSVRKVERPAGMKWREAVAANSVVVSTVAQGTKCTFDAAGNMWLWSGGPVKRTPDGTLTPYGLQTDDPIDTTELRSGSMSQFGSDPSGEWVIAVLQWNWATVLFRIMPDGKLVRVAGMTEKEIVAWFQAQGLPPPPVWEWNHNQQMPVDGLPATFHTVGLNGWQVENGQTIAMIVGGGDELLRRVDLVSGHTQHIMPDGSYQELSDRYGGVQIPYYIGAWMDGKDIYYRSGYWRSITQMTLQEVADPPPGVNVNTGWLNGVTNGSAEGWAIIGNDATVNATVEFVIDGQLAGSKVTDGPCQPCIDAHKANGGGTATVTPWFVWPIPAQFRDGQPHRLLARVGAFVLLNPNSEPKEIIFTLQPTQPDPGGNMQKTLAFQIEQQSPPNVAEKDHFKIVVDGVVSSAPLTATEIVIEVAPGHHVVEAQVANAADAFLVPAAHFEFDLAPGDTAPVIVSISLV